MKRKLTQRLVVASAIFFAMMTGYAKFAFSEDARVLPKGIGRFSFVYAQTGDINSQFDAGGGRESLTNSYDVQLNAANLKSVDPNGLGKLIAALNALPMKYNANSGKGNAYSGLTGATGQGQSIGDSVDLGTLVPSADVMETRYNMGFQYGLTDRLTIGFNIPIVKVTTQLNGQINGPNTAQSLQQAFQNDAVLSQPLQQLSSVNVAQIRTLVQQQAGYNVPQTTNQSGLGDVIFGGRYNYYKSRYETVISSFQAGLSLPTGGLKDPTTPTQVDLGNGAFGIGVAHIFNYSPLNWLTLSNGLHYTHFLPAHRNLIVSDPNSGELLPPTSDEQNVWMQLGDRYEVNLGISAQVTRAISLNTSYDWWWKKQDQYAGTSAPQDYTALSFETNEFTETVQAGVSWSSIEAFKRKQFPVPCDVAFNVYVPTTGRNAVISPYGTLEFALYL